MGAANVTEKLTDALSTTLWIAGPIVAGMLLAGVLVGVFQAATQVQEPALGFIARFAAATVVVFALGSEFRQRLVELAIAAWSAS